MPDRIALLTPFAFPSPRGNAVTVERIARGLRARGLDVRVWDASATAADAIRDEIAAYRPDLLHAFHAWRVGPLGVDVARAVGTPLVVTLTGTDVNEDLDDPGRGAAVREVLGAAHAVTAFHESIAERVAGALPAVANRLRIVPQAAWVDGAVALDLKSAWPGLPIDRVLFAFSGGIRPVKRPREVLGPLARVQARIPRVRLLYVGPVLDPGEGESLARALADLPWARHIGAVPHEAMASLLAQADVVLNSSASEGGMANSVLEALAVGRAVLAADIPGNCSVIEHGVTGLLYRDPGELEGHAGILAVDPELRRRLGKAGRALVARRYPPAREIDGYLAVYAAITSGALS